MKWPKDLGQRSSGFSGRVPVAVSSVSCDGQETCQVVPTLKTSAAALWLAPSPCLKPVFKLSLSCELKLIT
ncbi:hypothetical protein R1flu_022550 [Riccia fluitans]|uniref:Uncharacterized protein n=1 Tax=Riccia fluitans TaxID=41844 RepID=A0ABD1XTK5_9MARC